MTLCAECRYMKYPATGREELMKDTTNLFECQYHQVEGRMVHPADLACKDVFLIRDVKPTPDSRKSTPDYLDPENRMCASCSRCHVANAFSPARTGLCLEHGRIARFTDKKDCWRDEE